MKVLVTGGAGFIGRHTVELLVARGYEVAVIDYAPGGKEQLGLKGQVNYYDLDIGSEQLADIFEQERPDYCIHLAGQISVKRSLQDPFVDAKTNIMGTIHLLRQCVRYEVKKVIFSSSAAVYGNPIELPIGEDHETSPLSFYGMSKRVSEMYIQTFAERYGLNYGILRYANVYGMRQTSGGEGGVVAIFIDRLLHKLPVTIRGDGTQTRDFIYVKDVAEANIAALTRGDREVMNISSRQPVSIAALLHLLEGLTPPHRQLLYERAVEGDIVHSLLDNRKARRLLDWEPVYSLSDGLQETVHYEASCLLSSVGRAQTDTLPPFTGKTADPSSSIRI
ncbi:UDP-glucose 4-epimerase [Paenibacillus sp. CAA11]|uniref:NAD-dependent epimerase/dehydratase family protein n=1 Tax=Paenibacillus sp. CAA11 TaxID=1532905 RepID=UPI000D38294F|nr:NAD-dependent epimerase/dehydratase family protein [Paenibacillus sp. CAA11]AWB46403.1 UDP-glucose 4-epimerase [Paenibacillus sp. CAA11]